VQTQLAAAFHPGDHVLELGCGTGEDALWLARRGMHVTATDVSQSMLDVAQRKAAAANLTHLVDFAAIDLAAPAFSIVNCQLSIVNCQLSGAFSNFGPLNCLSDRRPLAEALAQWLRPGSRVVLVVMGPACPWEIGWHLLHGQPRPAFRRFRGGVDAHVGGGATVPVWYPSPRTLAAEFAPHFAVRGLLGIGSLLPPSYLSHLVERWPAAFGRLAQAERRLARAWPWTWLNDHYLLMLERR
jgi:SAM-dependent methyltransferase